MKTKQKNQFESYRALKALLAPKAATSGDSGLQVEFAVFQNNLETIDALAQSQALPVSARLRERDAAFAAAETATLVVAGRVLAHAVTNHLEEIADRTRLAPSVLRRMRRSSRLRVMRDVHAAASSVLAGLASLGVTEATLADLQGKIAAAEVAFDLPRGTVVQRKVATHALKAAFRTMNTHLRHSLDGVMRAVQQTDPELYQAYRETRSVIDRPGGLRSREALQGAAANSTPVTPQNAQPLAA